MTLAEQKRSFFYWASLAVIVVFFAVVTFVYLPSINLEVQGDGYEYILQTTAFLNHGTFGITQEDLEITKAQFYGQSDMLQWIYENHLHLLESGHAYSNHFGFYSALVSIVKTVLLVVGIYPLWAFPLTNLALWLGAILIVFFFLKTDDLRKFCVISLLLFNPILLYLDWVHTDIYIFAFEVIGLVFWHNRKYWLSILAISFAAIQNLAVLPLGMAVGLDYIYQCIIDYKANTEKATVKGFVFSYWRRIIPYGVFYVPSLIPMISTYLKFGTFSLVAEVAMESRYLFDKAFDYLFDLNLGVFPYEPILLVCFIILLIRGFKQNTRNAVFYTVAVLGVLFIISNQRQINCSMDGIMRYCVWLIPIMIYYTVLYWKGGACGQNKGLLLISSLQSVFSLVLVAGVLFFNPYSYLQFAPWAKVVLDKAPALYNPSHGIFYSRALGGETYHSADPVFYYNDEGFIRKILLSKEAKEKFYSDAYVLVNTEENNAIIDKTSLDRKTVDDGEYVYLNTTENIIAVNKYQLGSEILAGSSGYNADKYFMFGLSANEGWGSWTDGKRVRFGMFLDDSDATMIQCRIDVYTAFYQPQRVSISMGEEVVYSDVISGDEDIIFTFEKPEHNIVSFLMELPDAVSPSEITQSGDIRVLGLGISSVRMTDMKAAVSKYDKESGICFTAENYNAGDYVQRGMSYPEEWGSWTDGDEVKFILNVEGFKAETLEGYLDVCTTFYQPQSVTVLVNGAIVFEDTIEGNQDIAFSFPNPENGIVQIEMLLPDSVQPSAVMDSTDNRDLGLGLLSLKISE